MKKCRVLVADDEEHIRLTLAEALGVMDVEVESVGTGPDVLARLGDRRFDLLLLDIRLPLIDGMTVLRWVRDHRPMMAVVMISAYATPHDAVEAIKVGASDFLQKPFTVEEIRCHVSRVLRDRPCVNAQDPDGSIPSTSGGISDRQFDAAAAYIYEALRLDNRRPDAYDLLGVLYQLRGDLNEAMRCFEKALSLDFGYAPARRNLYQLLALLRPEAQ